MSSNPKAGRVTDVVLCWHMHQPDYRLEGRYLKPWTWLHAIKDYTDMAAHLEKVEGARAVVNFSPVLIEQLLDYPQRIRHFLGEGAPMGDFVLDALGAEAPQADSQLLAQLLRVNEDRMKNRFPAYARLFDRVKAGSIEVEELPDLLVWYVIAWLGESLRGLPVIQALGEKAGGFSLDDRRALLALIAETIAGLLPRYRKLMDSGAVELSVTPHSHPILPLLLDFDSARDAAPDAPLPEDAYPGGAERCDWQLAEARQLFEEVFGAQPAGCWPSEGALSQATLDVLGRHGFRWTASGSQVLHNTLRHAEVEADDFAHLAPWQAHGANETICFFRDDGLSDLIGFEYSKWPAEGAVEDFIARLERIADDSDQDRPVLSMIMDGENAWEYFPQNGWAFLRRLYTRLAQHPGLNLTTFTEVIAGTRAEPLPELCAGSWVHGSLSTWIGDAAKNRAWELLCGAKRAVDAALEPFEREPMPDWARAVLRQLAVCEASDWAWWLSTEQAMPDSPEFDALYRRQLAELFRLLGMAPPAELDLAIVRYGDSGGDDGEVVGAMRRSVGTRG